MSTPIHLITSLLRYDHVSTLIHIFFSECFPQLQKGANDACSDDVRRIKEEIANWINQTHSPMTPLSLKQRDGRGLQSDVTGRLLCPIELPWDDNEYIISSLSYPLTYTFLQCSSQDSNRGTRYI